MAKNDNIQDFIKDIADAIRSVDGTTGLINPQNFSKKIKNLTGTGSSKFGELVDGSIVSIEESDISSITKIRDYAFAYCNNLKTVFIPNNIVSIGANAFYSCTKLTEITMESLTPPSVTNTTFPSTISAIYVKYGAYESYLTKWSAYANKIVRLPAIPSTITVTVNNYLGELVSGAKVTISGNGQTYVGNTNEQGVFVQGDLQPATYTISVADLDGFKTPNNIEVIVNENTKNVATVTYLEKPQGVIYGVRIALNNSNPSSSVEYTDDAIGYSGAYMQLGSSFVDNGWKDRFPFNQIKPCLFKDGQVVKYLNPNNYTQDIDGNTVDITSGNAGDVMIEIPKIYYRLYSDDNYQYIQIANYLVDADKWCCYAHTYKGVEKNHLYLSAYEGCVLNSKLRSLSGKSPSVNLALGTYRNYAQANGNGYQLMSFNLVILMQALYAIMFKNLDSQSALGYGNAKGQTTIYNAGRTNTRGMYYGTSGNESNKLFGVENIYGNINTMVDGCFADNNGNLVILNPINPNCEFNNNGTNYLSIPTGITQTLDGYIKRVMGGNLTGFIPKDVSGSSATYYCDGGYLGANGGLCLFGGTRWFDTFAGMFSITLAYTNTYVAELHGSRIMYI